MTRQYRSYFAASRLNITDVFLFQLCYDATWTLARALNNTISGKLYLNNIIIDNVIILALYVLLFRFKG